MCIKITVLLMSLLGLILSPDAIIKHRNKQDEDKMDKKIKIAISVASVVLTMACESTIAYLEEDLLKFLMLAVVMALSGIIIIIDCRVRIIPNITLFPMLITIAAYRMYSGYLSVTDGSLSDMAGSVFGSLLEGTISMVVVCYILLFLTSILGYSGKFGAGDIKYLSVGAMLFGLTSGEIVGMLIGWVGSQVLTFAPLLLTKKITMKSSVAYGPYIGCGVIFGIIWLYL